MDELSLFTGAGGGLLGTHLLGWRPIGYVEFNDYCQRVIRQRIADGILPNAPIFGDIRAFISEGYAASYTGMVDVITAGFPCQPFSTAGKRLAEDDPRNMWPATIECIRVVRPKYALLENVPGLLSSGYFGTVLGDLAESGYDVRWRILSVAEMGAPHKRDRLWIVAHAKCPERRPSQSDGNDRYMHVAEREKTSSRPCAPSKDGRKKSLAYSNESGRERTCSSELGQNTGTNRGDNASRRGDVADADKERLQVTQYEPIKRWATGAGERARSTSKSWWDTEPAMGRVANGVAHRVDRLKATGNGQVPAVVAAVWRLLTE